MRNLHPTGFVYADEWGVGICLEIRLDAGAEPSRVIMSPDHAEAIAKEILKLAADFVSDEELSPQSPAP